MKVWVKTGHLFFINLGLYPKKGEPGAVTVHLKRPGRSTREWTRCKLVVDRSPAVERARAVKLAKLKKVFETKLARRAAQ